MSKLIAALTVACLAISRVAEGQVVVSSSPTEYQINRLIIDGIADATHDYCKLLKEFPPRNYTKFFEALGGNNPLHKEFMLLQYLPHDGNKKIVDRFRKPFVLTRSDDKVVIASTHFGYSRQVTLTKR